MLHEAIRELYDTAVLIQGNTVDDVVVKDENGDEVSIVKDDVTAKITELEDATSYIHARSSDYKSIKEQLDMQYWDKVNGTTNWEDHIAKVKSDNPKASE
tara:strand:+ start:578 stop:877 length:300 start_codon:yes stop_codon:yes gene_type:complete